MDASSFKGVAVGAPNHKHVDGQKHEYADLGVNAQRVMEWVVDWYELHHSQRHGEKARDHSTDHLAEKSGY